MNLYNPEVLLISRDELAIAIAEGLSIDEAIRIALLNNRQLQANFMSIGVAKADWVQSGLLTNPSLNMLVRFPTDGGRSMIEASFVQNILELWRIPIRKEISQHALDRAVFSIAAIASDLVANTRNAYYEALAADQLWLLAEEHLQIAERAYEAVGRLREGGVATKFDESLARSPFLKAQVALRTGKYETRAARRRLASLLSVDCDVDNLELIDSLPDPQVPDFDVESLIDIAMQARFDLRAYRAAIAAAASRIKLQTGKTLSELSIGASIERQAIEGEPIIGPAFTVTIPIFDQNQAQIAKAEYLYIQATKKLESIELGIAQDIRDATDRASIAAVTVSFYQKELLPQADQNLEFATTLYTSGQASLIAMLESQRSFLESRSGYRQARRDSATAISRLEQVVGKQLTMQRLQQ